MLWQFVVIIWRFRSTNYKFISQGMGNGLNRVQRQSVEQWSFAEDRSDGSRLRAARGACFFFFLMQSVRRCSVIKGSVIRWSSNIDTKVLS